jgi:hypothetical protein
MACNRDIFTFDSLPNLIRMLKVKGEDMSMACCMHGGEDEFIQGFGRKARRKETHRMPLI